MSEADQVIAEVLWLELRLLDPVTRASSSLWCRGADGWQVLFHQGTPVAPAE